MRFEIMGREIVDEMQWRGIFDVLGLPYDFRIVIFLKKLFFAFQKPSIIDYS